MLLFMYFIQHCFFCRPSDPLCRRMLGSKPGLLRLWHWQSDALTTRLCLIHTRLCLISSPHSAIPHPSRLNFIHIFPVCICFLISICLSCPILSLPVSLFAFLSSLGRYVFGSEISYNKAPPRLPGLGC